ISYVLPGPGAGGRKPRSLSLTGAIVSAVIGLFLVMVLAAIIALHVHNRRADEPAPAAPTAGVAPAVGATAPVPLQDFIVPEQLNAYELPIPDR
ncbi:MAG: hypothetical protein GX595_19215, partial [Lentisphaerae bacterium]|nr:hypothetical protein [Lentisphaerota bacterium]